MANDQSEPLNPKTSVEPSERVAPIITRGLIFTRYVVAEVYGRMERKLGLKPLRNDEDIAWAVQRRLPLTAIESLMLHGVSEKEIYWLILSRRSLTTHRERHEPLTCDESDRAMRIARLISLAEWVFGDDVAAAQWLRSSFRLDPRTPLEFLQTEAGAWLIEVELVRIAEGVYV